MARELQALVKDLPVVLEETGKKAACLKDAIEFYTAFTKFVSDWQVLLSFLMLHLILLIYFMKCLS